MFRQFDVDYDKVTFDGVSLNKPSYLSPTQWFQFWEMFDGELIESKVNLSFDKGYDVRSGEQDKEIEQVKDFCFKTFKQLDKEIELILEDDELNAHEKLKMFQETISDARDEIWDL